MSALQGDLFGLMGEGDIQSCGPEIGLISAEWMQIVSRCLTAFIIMLMQQMYSAGKLYS